MSSKAFVGNLSYAVNSDELLELFEECGRVVQAKVILDRETNRSRGFGFVEFDNDDDLTAAITKFNGFELRGRPLVVSKAEERQDRGPRQQRDFNHGGNDGRSDRRRGYGDGY